MKPGGNADKLGGRIRAGDQLVACSATVLKAGKEGEFEREGYGQRPYDNFETIMFPTAGQVCRHCCVKGCTDFVSHQPYRMCNALNECWPWGGL